MALIPLSNSNFNSQQPYNDLPLLPPKADIETKAILKKAITAGRALAELKGLGDTIPNQSILVNSVILQEAKASSEIENIITTNDALFRAFSAKNRSNKPGHERGAPLQTGPLGGLQCSQKKASTG